LAMVEHPDLVPRSVELALSDAVRMQDFATYMGTLLANRAARELAWNVIRQRWAEVRKKADSPMLLRRLIEALGALPERRHLEEVQAFLDAHPVEGAKQAIAQTLERLRMDVALRERLVGEVGAFALASSAYGGRSPAVLLEQRSGTPVRLRDGSIVPREGQAPLVVAAGAEQRLALVPSRGAVELVVTLFPDGAPPRLRN